MPTRDVVLTDHRDQMIEDLELQGSGLSVSEPLRSAIQVGLADLSAGHYIEVDDAGLETLMEELSREAGQRVVRQNG